MKKRFVLLACFIFILSLTSCQKNETTENESTSFQDELSAEKAQSITTDEDGIDSDNIESESENQEFLEALDAIEGDYTYENSWEIPTDSYCVEKMFGTPGHLVFEDAGSFLEAFGFVQEDPFYEFYADDELKLTLYYDEETQLGCGDYGSSGLGFCFVGLEAVEWTGYRWGDYMDPVTVYHERPGDYMGDYSYDEVKEYNEKGQLVEYRVTNVADLVAEYVNVEHLKDGEVLWNDALVVNYSYWADGTLLYREYYHNLYMFGTSMGTLKSWFDEQGRPVYEQAYITHGSLNWFYIYEDEDEIPEYALYVDNNGGQAEFKMYSKIVKNSEKE